MSKGTAGLKFLLKLLAGAVGLIVLVVIVQVVASETGEVVVLTTTDAAGAPQETRLWIVDHEGSAWLRAGSNTAGWFGRLSAHPDIEVERGGHALRYRATAVPESTSEINRLMAEKYGWADAYIGLMFSREHSLAIRLDPPSD